jgi:hypothetical protein
MNLKILALLLIFVLQNSFAQSEKLFKGTVLSNNFPIAKVDVVNVDTKKNTTTDTNGNFSILGKTGDLLVFISKNHELKRVILNSKLQPLSNLVVQLDLKPEMLKDVIVTRIPSVHLSLDKKYEQKMRNEIAFEREQNRLRIPSVYDGTTLGVDFIKLGSMILDLLRKEKEPAKVEPPKIAFKDLAKNTFEPNFFTQTLHLKEEEVGLFLEFCDADPKSKELEKNNNQLALLDFLFQKRDEFKKL